MLEEASTSDDGSSTLPMLVGAKNLAHKKKLYSLLNIPENASPEVIKHAYETKKEDASLVVCMRDTSKDKTKTNLIEISRCKSVPDPKKFEHLAELEKAFSILNDPEKKKLYDEKPGSTAEKDLDVQYDDPFADTGTGGTPKYYDVLQIGSTSTVDQIKTAYTEKLALYTTGVEKA